MTTSKQIPSGNEKRRQLEESVAEAMLRHRQEGEAVLAKTQRLKALREAHEASSLPPAKPQSKASAKGAKAPK